MNAFEEIVSALLAADGYWTQTNYFVNLTKEQKQKINRHTSPRWEIDLVAFKPLSQELLAIECKSYMDSTGVQIRSFDSEDTDARWSERYKLFNEPVLREVVLGQLKAQLLAAGMIKDPEPAVGGPIMPHLGLACGKIASAKDRTALVEHFKARGWFLITDTEIVDRVKRLAPGPYENSAMVMIAKLLLRAAERDANKS